MIFRTEIETPRHPVIEIDHHTPILMIGSCFTDNIGEILCRDGFDAVHNPMGTLYNPASICRALRLAKGLDSPNYVEHGGMWHCMDFATKYTDADPAALKYKVDGELATLSSALDRAKVVIVTLGTAYVFEMSERGIVGNCHKLPADMFSRRRLDVDEATRYLNEICSLCDGKQLIFTVSPIRHTADRLHGNQISKATLQLAIEHLCRQTAEISPETSGDKNVAAPCAPLYFPVYEIMLDDLRDYRFYASDMKHPSPIAIDYIYEIFAKYYFTPATSAKAAECRKAYKRLAHKPILDNATEN